MKQPDKKQRSTSTGENVQYIAQPVIISHDVDTPDVEPLFANHFEFLVSNTDIFLDIGIIDPRDMDAMVRAAQENPSEVQQVKFSVLQRVAMSPATFAMLVNKANQLLNIMKERHASERQSITKQQR